MDASVLVKWFTANEEHSAQATRLKEDYKSATINLFIPALTSWEMGNFLGRVFPEKTAVQAFNIFKNYRITQLMLTLEATAVTFMIMKRCPGVSFYDASYHALAIQNEGIFITDDQKYYERAKKMGSIKLLKDY